MINYIRNALSTDYSIKIAHRLNERKGWIGSSAIVSRFLQFFGVGLLALAVSLVMYFLAKSGTVEQLHTQRLVTFVAISGLVLFGTSIVASFVLLWDTVITLYVRGVAAENALIESVFDETLDETQEVEIIEEPLVPPSIDHTDEDLAIIGKPVYVRVNPVQQNSEHALKARVESVRLRRVYKRSRTGSIRRTTINQRTVNLNIPYLNTSDFSDDKFTHDVESFLKAVGSNFDLSDIPIGERRKLARNMRELKAIGVRYRGSTGPLIRTLLEESANDLESQLSLTPGMTR